VIQRTLSNPRTFFLPAISQMTSPFHRPITLPNVRRNRKKDFLTFRNTSKSFSTIDERWGVRSILTIGSHTNSASTTLLVNSFLLAESRPSRLHRTFSHSPPHNSLINSPNERNRHDNASTTVAYSTPTTATTAECFT
jgi:hypothetical protein